MNTNGIFTITADTTSLVPVGTVFQQGGKGKRPTTIIGYHVQFDSDTQKTDITYRVQYEFGGQTIITDVPRNTVMRAML
jgi:hypothetical protein